LITIQYDHTGNYVAHDITAVPHIVIHHVTADCTASQDASLCYIASYRPIPCTTLDASCVQVPRSLVRWLPGVLEDQHLSSRALGDPPPNSDHKLSVVAGPAPRRRAQKLTGGRPAHMRIQVSSGNQFWIPSIVFLPGYIWHRVHRYLRDPDTNGWAGRHHLAKKVDRATQILVKHPATDNAVMQMGGSPASSKRPEDGSQFVCPPPSDSLTMRSLGVPFTP